MSQVTQPRITLPLRARSRRAVVLAAALAVLVAAAIVLVIALSDGSPDSAAGPASLQAQPSLRSDGGPEESRVAAAAGSQSVAGPNESRVAAAISGH